MLKCDPFTHVLDDPWAPHPVVNRHICSGGGGGGGSDVPTPNAPSAPDYTAYIKRMTEIGEKGQTWAGEIYNDMKKYGVDLVELARTVGGKAGAAADTQQATSDRLQQQWEGLSKPLYEAQQRDALRMIGDLPGTEEHYAGQQGANAAASIDAQKAALQRKMLAEGHAGGQPGIASQALDTQAAIGRAAAVTAAAEQGRYGARKEARDVTHGALKDEEFIPGVASEQGKLAATNRSQQADIANKGAATAAGLYTPAIQMYGQSIAPMKEWGDTMGRDYDSRLKAYGIDVQKYQAQNQAAEADDGGSFLDTVLPLAGGIAGSFLGPMGTSVGSTLGGMAGKAASGAMSKAATGGKIMGRRVPRGYANGGAIDTGAPGENYIDPSLSPSGGEQVDDVPAMVSAGEFVIPERTVDWFGEKYFQNLIAKSDRDREQQTVAAPEEVAMDEPPQEQALQMQAPMFRSEGARV